MPPEPLPWDRKELFRERKHERSESLGSVSRWREAPHHGPSSREFGRWGSGECRSRPPGHGKQGGWHLYSEESGHGFAPSRSGEKILDDEYSRPSGYRGDGRYNRSGRENRGSFSQKDWKGHTWEADVSPNGPGRPHGMSDQRSVDNMVMDNSHPHSDLASKGDQLHLREQHDKTGSVNGLGTGKRFDRENSLGSIEWKPLKWTRSGSLSSRGSSFSHSGSSKSIGVDSTEAQAEVQIKNITPLQSPSGDAGACVTSAAPVERSSCSKKPRLGWGEGLAKYEKKKVEGPDDISAAKHGLVVCTTEPLHPHGSNLAEKSPRVPAFADPATPSSVGCSSSPGVEDKPFAKAAYIDNETSNLCVSPHIPAQNHLEGIAFNLENLDLTSIANLSTSLGELLQCDDSSSVDSSFVRSTAINKLLVWKRDVSKALEVTESEIDLLENELKLLMSDPGKCHFLPAASSSLVDYQAKLCDKLVTASNLIPRPTSLHIVSSRGVVMESAGDLEEGLAEVKVEDVDSPGTVTSKFIAPHPSEKPASVSDTAKHHDCSVDLDANSCQTPEMKLSVFSTVRKDTGGLLTPGDATEPETDYVCSSDANMCGREESSYDVLLASNKDIAKRASEVLEMLLPTNLCHIDLSRTCGSSRQNDKLIKEKISIRKHFLNFKERVIALKFRAFQHLWKEDMRLLSVRKYRAKSQKRLELILRIQNGGYQKHRSSIRSRFSSPAGNASLVPTTEIVNFTSKLLSDSQAKVYRNLLKMPSLILDKKGRMGARFVSSNALVEDPCAVEKERTLINPWTLEEKESFMDKLAVFGKDFKKISTFLDHKTVADCIEFYYKNHKSDWFVKTRKKMPEFSVQGKSCSNSNYLVTSGKRWNRKANAAYLDMLGAVSAIVANADDGGVENQQKRTARLLLEAAKPRCDDGTMEGSGSVEIFDTERETVAADVLAGICGSLSSEAMSSCITSSFDPGEGYQDWKCQKMSSSVRWPLTLPLTPEVTHSVDDETCSDESCGEMDPADWRDEEKSIFIQAVSSYGKDFTMISRSVGTKTRDQCKVFFSKARKCLGLDAIHPAHANDVMPVNEDAKGGGSDTEDACIVEKGPVICSEKSGPEMDEEQMLSDLSMKQCESDHVETISLQSLPNRLEESNGTSQIIHKDTELQMEKPVSDDWRPDEKLDVGLGCDGSLENGVHSECQRDQVHNVASLPSGSDGQDEPAEQGCSWGTSELKVENDCGLSEPVTGLATAVPGSDKQLLTEQETRSSLPEISLNDNQELQGGISEVDANGQQQDGNSELKANVQTDLNCLKDDDSNIVGNVSTLVADRDASVEVGANTKQWKTALESNSTQEPHVTSLDQDDCLVTANSMPQGSSVSHHDKKTLNHDLSSIPDIRIVRDKCQQSASMGDCNQHQSKHSDGVEATHILCGYPLPGIMKQTNGDATSKSPVPLLSSKLNGNFQRDKYLLQECSSSKTRDSVAEFPFLPQEETTEGSRTISCSSSDSEKPLKNGDIKLFGQILTHLSPHPQMNGSTHQNENNSVQHPKLCSKPFNLKFNAAPSVDVHSLQGKVDGNDYMSLENVPIRSYGFWDGDRMQTGFSSLPDSAIFLAKYPAALGNYSSSTNLQQQTLHSSAKSNEQSVNGASLSSVRVIGSSNGVADYNLYRSREGSREKPFTVDAKQQDMLLSERQRQRINGFEAVSSTQQPRVMAGINGINRGGILGISDPVAVLKMHHARTEQYNGQQGSITREEESRRGKGDIGR